MPKINKNNRKFKAKQPQEEQSGEQPNMIVNSEESQEMPITEMITENLGNPTASDQTAEIDMNIKITVDTVISNSSPQKFSKITMVVNLVDNDDSEEEIISSVVVEEPEEAENTTAIRRSVTIVKENNSQLYPREENDTNTNRVVPQNRTHYLQEQRVFFPVPRRAQIIPKPPMFRCTVIDLEEFFHPGNLENMLRRSATIRQRWRAMERQENNSQLYPSEENDSLVPQNRTHYLQEQRVFFPVPRRVQIIPKPPMFRCTVIDLEEFFHPDNLENMLRRSATIRQRWRAMERQGNRRSGNLFSYFMHFLFGFGLVFMLITIIGAGTDFMTSQNFWIWLMRQLSH